MGHAPTFAPRMIPHDTIAQIFEAARIEEVVGDFVQLKKKGSNLWGRCPFHNEKTPSFSVSPGRGIYKCFGCGKGGSAVNFIMEHEHLSYPEALRYLARKYAIEVEEEQRTPEQEAETTKREAIFLTLAYAQRILSDNLWNTDEGRSIGLGYFRERGFRDDIIDRFQLGYSFDRSTSFTDKALQDQHKKEALIESGMSLLMDDGRVIDRFRGRVMFPIHNQSGRVIGFGGRILRTDKKLAKYVNTPETEIYHKKDTLYGIFQAKRAIIEKDNCFLVEGYTDVISMHQAGIANVVASSGTSLTIEQVRMLRRYTQNLTIMYDGDPAGIKAAMRGIDMVLEEGLNVRTLLFPDGEDPDSFARSRTADELQQFITANTKDFIRFKAELLMEEAQGDPIRTAALIKDIVGSIALVPDSITRSLYVRECAQLMHMEEQVLVFELNRLRRKRADERHRTNAPDAPDEATDPDASRPDGMVPLPQPVTEAELNSTPQERDLVRLLLQYGHKDMLVRYPTEDGTMTEEEVNLALFIVHELDADAMDLNDPVLQSVLLEFRQMLAQDQVPTMQHFVQHTDPAITALAADLGSTPYVLSNRWQDHNIFVTLESDLLTRAARSSINMLKLRRLDMNIVGLTRALRTPTDELDEMATLQELTEMKRIRTALAREIGSVVVR